MLESTERLLQSILTTSRHPPTSYHLSTVDALPTTHFRRAADGRITCDLHEPRPEPDPRPDPYPQARCETAELVDLPDESGNSPLMLASEYDALPLVKILIDADADVNAVRMDGANALMLACRTGRTQIVRALIEADADPWVINEQAGKFRFRSAIESAARNGRARTLKLGRVARG